VCIFEMRAVSCVSIVILLLHILCVTCERIRITQSRVDGMPYKVQELPNYQTAADLLSKIRRNLDKLTLRLQSALPNDYRVKNLSDRYKPENLQESEFMSDKTSFTVNKGEQIHLCLRSPHTNNFEQENTIRYIAIHELAHIISDSTGHTTEFWDNFRFLLSYAVKWQLHNNVDYRRNPVNYCGTRLTDAPLRLNKDRTVHSYL
jgi:predicted metal-dependent hydrolase